MEEHQQSPKLSHLSQFEPISRDVLNAIPEALIKKYMVVPVQKNKGRLLVAVPGNNSLVKPQGLQMVTGCPVDFVPVPTSEVADFIKKIFSGEPQPSSASHEPENPVFTVIHPAQSNVQFGKEIQDLLTLANKERASEIAIDIQGSEVSVRFRIRGILVKPQCVLSYDQNRYDAMCAEVGSKGETRESNGNTFTQYTGRVAIQEKVFQIEVILTQTKECQALTFYMAPSEEALYNPKKWGMTDREAEYFERILDKKQGLILFCGPEKISVDRIFYGCLRNRVAQSRHVMTVEERIDDHVRGVSQFLCSGNKDQFNNMIATTLDHKPDVLGIKPLASKQAFENSFEGSLKGCLVMGRTYALDASDMLYRLIGMDIPPYWVGSVLQGIVVQQTIRLTCQKCQTRDPKGREISKEIGIPTAMRPSQYFRGKGCLECDMTGFDKETNLFEVVEMSDDIREALSNSPKPELLRRTLSSRGVRTLRQAAIHKAVNGQTSLQEVLRVTPK